MIAIQPIRLAVLLVAGVVARAATADPPNAQATCLTATVAVGQQKPSAKRPEADDVLRDMLLHD